MKYNELVQGKTCIELHVARDRIEINELNFKVEEKQAPYVTPEVATNKYIEHEAINSKNNDKCIDRTFSSHTQRQKYIADLLKVS